MLQKDSTTDTNRLSFPKHLLLLGEVRISRANEARVTLPRSVAVESDVSSSCRAFLHDIETNYMLGNWLMGRTNLTTKITDFERISKIARGYVPSDM